MTNVHRFQVGDRVIYQPEPSMHGYAGAYTIERLLPFSNGEAGYVIKSVKDGHVRNAPGHELTLAGHL